MKKMHILKIEVNMRLILLICLLPLFTYSQVQIGQDIDGDAVNDLSTQKISLSSNGNIVAIGSIGNIENDTDSGHVRIYENNNGVWTQIGQDLDGKASGDISGIGLSLSSDGSIVAIGAPANDGNGVSSGHVRIYENINGVWMQVGQDIDGEADNNLSGAGLSLSSDGNIVAIGATINSDNGRLSGQVRVYKNNNGVWAQIGQDINAEASGDFSGIGLNLSSDGSIVAIGARGNDGNGTDSGHVRVYENQSGTWTQKGQDIDGEAINDLSGISLSLSVDGNIIAIGAKENDGNGTDSGHVRIYNNNNNGLWTQIVQEQTGLSPVKIILEVRLRKAYELVVTDKYQSISEVLYTVGLNSRTYFNKVFTKRFGIKPGELIKKLKAESLVGYSF
jgi:hypothetical protein